MLIQGHSGAGLNYRSLVCAASAEQLLGAEPGELGYSTEPSLVLNTIV
jgi:hypothetical protein